jgi:hypothetical protein
LARASLLALLAVLGGCATQEADARSEAAHLGRAIDALRNADNAAKPAHLANLRATVCSVPDLCAVRSACLSGYELHLRALEQLATAMAAAADGGTEAAAALLESARSDLERARTLTERCTNAQGEMVRKYQSDG